MKPATKKILVALERVFAAEINDRLPFQSKARIFIELVEQGYLEPMSRIFGAGTRFKVTVSGYQLTHLGRMTYCEYDDNTQDAEG